MKRSLGVYIHWPFCARICPYCDFNVYKNRNVDVQEWVAVFQRDLHYWRTQTKANSLGSIYFGGGTPSLAPVEVIEAVIGECKNLWSVEGQVEITLEANPTDSEQSRFSAFAGAGVNRLSLGVQSLRDEALGFLGRDHNAEAARKAIATAQDNFSQVTFDLIYARPQQTLDEWRTELSEALSFGTTHLSLYQLTIEPGTAFHRAVSKGRWAPLSEEECADQFDLAQELTAAAGLPAYEISNHAAPGDQSRHNMIYWTGGDYIGIGPGAHGRLTANGQRIATLAPSVPTDYLNTPPQNWTVEKLNDDEWLVERLTMGLRLHEGLTLYADDHFYTDDHRATKLNQLIQDELLTLNCGQLKATAKGRALLNAVLYELLG